MDGVSLKECSKCKNLVPDAESICDQCGGDAFNNSIDEQPPLHSNLSARQKTKSNKKVNSKKSLLIRNIAAGSFLLFFFYGNFHYVHGSTYSGKAVISKVSFSFSETFVNTDQILNVPVIAAKSNWPLAVAALQREGFLESDAQREKRIKAEVDAEFKKNQKEAEIEFNKTQADIEEQTRRDLYKLEHGKYPDQ